ncbi:response regulator [Methylomonas sp. MO1]|uniref:response regulator n=1 Tax=Methylomonas sp. MO1 TaxID=3073619 RepID=UPI0028A3D9CB|nr:response regulator [Methylomonas sp. MO1]MDT4292177.1 response regulator [Methylomonas sp. MO1]
MTNQAEFKRDLTIKTKLVLIMLATSILSLLLAGAGFIAQEHMRVKQDMGRDLSSLARIIASRSTVALSFNDSGVANATLAALSVKQSVVSACIYDSANQLFALYEPGLACPPQHPESSAIERPRFDDAYCTVSETIALDGRTLGRVWIASSLAELDSLWRDFLAAAMGIVMLSGLFALLLASSLQQVVSGPLVRLKKTVETINSEKNYTLRATQESNDELGALIQAFNTMIATIEARDSELLALNWQLAENEKLLASINEGLEERVAARTTELADINAKLAHNSVMLATVLDSMSQGLIAFDSNLKLLVWNKKLSEVRGYPESMLAVGRDHADFMQFDLTDPQLRFRNPDAELKQLLEEIRRFQPHNFTRQRLDNRVIEISGGPIADGGFVSTYEDVTLRKQAELALKEARDAAQSATQTKSQFLANMSHEIRTPMNGVLGMLHLALQTELTASQRNYLAKAHSSARTLLGILNDILDFSKIEAGKLALEETEFRFDSVVEQLADMIGYQAGLKGIEFLIRHDPQIPPVLLGDPLRFGQVLTNLCGNALKFTEAGELELAFYCLAKTDSTIDLRISVRDTGIGMSEDDQKKLFQEFTQADQGTSRRFGGTGLGLAICKTLVEMMHGRIWIEQSQLGQGTTFCFTVRLGVATDTLLHQDALERSIGVLLAEVRVLVVDDNEASREIISDMLRPFQLRVSCSASAAAALIALRDMPADQPFDVVLMDWKMPGMNGDEAIRQIRADTSLVQQPKIIMVTAYGSEDVMRLAGRAGIDGFLIKPVSPSSLLDAILSALGRGRVLGVVDKFKQLGGADIAGIKQLQGIRLLLVEDNEINREFACELLRSHEIQVDEAMNGEEAVAMVRQHHYDAVLMDIQMPVLDGLQATVKIRALAQSEGDQRYATMPIIAMTAHAMARDVEKSLEAGMNDHVTKPIDPDRLFKALATWIPLTADGGQSQEAARIYQIADYPEDLQTLTSLDIVQGIRRIGGNPDAYRKQLYRFKEHYPDAVAEIRGLINAGELRQAEERCHALKGVSGNLGATDLFEAAAGVDIVLKQNQIPPAEHLQHMEGFLRKVIGEIQALQTAADSQTSGLDQPTAPVADAEIAADLQKLSQLLESDLGAAETMLEQLQRSMAGHQYLPLLEEIAKKIDRFAIDEALTQLSELLQKF